MNLDKLETALPDDGTATARGITPCDWKLWVQPLGGKPFLLDWGTEEAMMAKLEAETKRRVWLRSADGKTEIEL